jgi:hypothetical protein
MNPYQLQSSISQYKYWHKKHQKDDFASDKIPQRFAQTFALEKNAAKHIFPNDYWY